MQAVAPDLNVIGFKSSYTRPAGRATLVFLHDLERGDLIAMIEGEWMGKMRTAATTGLATKLLARADAGVVACFGTGRHAGFQLEAVCAVRPVREAPRMRPQRGAPGKLLHDDVEKARHCGSAGQIAAGCAGRRGHRQRDDAGGDSGSRWQLARTGAACQCNRHELARPAGDRPCGHPAQRCDRRRFARGRGRRMRRPGARDRGPALFTWRALRTSARLSRGAGPDEPGAGRSRCLSRRGWRSRMSMPANTFLMRHGNGASGVELPVGGG